MERQLVEQLRELSRDLLIGIEESHKNLNLLGMCPDRGSDPEPPKYKSEILTLESNC
jgi:hypothetical protein